MIEDLIKERKSLGISAKTFSKIIGFSAVWIYKVERGERRVSESFIKAYADGIKKIKTIFDLVERS